MMLHRILAIAAGVTVFGVAALPQTASAQYYGEYARRPVTVHTQDDIEIDGDRARVEHRQDIRPGQRGWDGGYRSVGGPLVYDERFEHPDGWRGERGYGAARPYGYRGAAYGGPLPGYGGGYARPYGAEAYGGGFRPVSAPVDYGVVGERSFEPGTPDEGCTTEQSRSVTPFGWQKTVTHRTCYRR